MKGGSLNSGLPEYLSSSCQIQFFKCKEQHRNMKTTVALTEIELLIGDITDQNTDAIVNAANSNLAHGGGVAGAIVRSGGYEIQEESDLWIKTRGGVPVGSSAITSAGKLPARYIIHTVGPRMGEGSEEIKLKKATLSALNMAVEHDLHSIAFPAVSTGIFGYPVDRCADVMLNTVCDFCLGSSELTLIRFALFGQKTYNEFEKTLKRIISSYAS